MHVPSQIDSETKSNTVKASTAYIITEESRVYVKGALARWGV